MVQAKLVLEEVPDEVVEKINNDWNGEEFRALKRLIKERLNRMNRVKLRKLLRGERVDLDSKDTNNQKPEYFAKQSIIEPLLDYLGFGERDREVIKSKPIGSRKYPDYRTQDAYGDLVLIEAEPMHMDLWSKGHGVHQVADWMDSTTKIGIATNGLRWVLIYYTNGRIEPIIELDLRSFLHRLVFKYGLTEESELKRLLAKFYFYFSKRWLRVAIDKELRALVLKKDKLTSRFYNELLEIAFGLKEVMKNGKLQVECVGEGLLDYVSAPSEATDEDKKKFVILLLNRLIFIVFLEDVGLVAPDLLRKLYRDWAQSKSTNFYENYLKPLFYRVFNTEPDKRDEDIKRIDLYREIPYLNGGLFKENLPHEENYRITNAEVLKKAIDLLESKNLTIRKGTQSAHNRLNPDVLGYMYEKLINYLTTKGRKGLGAYYTPEEITEFISRKSIEKIVLEKIKKVLREEGGFKIDFETLNEVLNIKTPITRDARILQRILDELDTIRILDPAVGSGHFLISTLYVLLDIRKSIYNIMGVERVDVFREKMSIILNNLYGVDLDGSAVEMTKLRLWLALMEDMNVEEVKKGNVVLPNIEYNVRVGNSLVGWLHENLNVMNFVFDESMENLFLGLKYSAVGEEWNIIKNAEALLKSQGGNLVENYVSAYFEIYKLYRNSFGMKSDMLKKILEKIRNTIYREVTYTYLKSVDSRMSEQELREFRGVIKSFHWAVDFGWIMRDGGFDVVIGNPPHGANISKVEKKFWELLYKLIRNSRESAKVFVERAFALLKDGGVFGFVIPKASTYSQAWEDYRNFISMYRIDYHIDLGKAFEGVRHEQIAIIAEKREADNYEYIGGVYDKKGGKIDVKGTVPSTMYSKLKILPCYLSNMDAEILEYISGKNFGDLGDMDVFRGLPRRLKSSKGEKCVKGKEIRRFKLDKTEELVIAEDNNKINRLRRKKVIAQRIVAHVTNPRDRIIIMAYPDLEGLLTFETVTNIVPLDEGDVVPLSVLLNSSFVSWYVYYFIYNRAIRDMDFDAYFVKRIPVPDYTSIRELLTALGNYLLYLYGHGDSRAEFFDRIANAVVYELYLGDRFREDGIYGEETTLGQHLLDIFESEGFETSKRAISWVWKVLSEDARLSDLLRKIENHEWVRHIEGR